MHICLDFIPELLSQPSLEKQVFAVDLVSHLSVQYALPKSLSVARLAINTLSTLLLGTYTSRVNVQNAVSDVNSKTRNAFQYYRARRGRVCSLRF